MSSQNEKSQLAQSRWTLKSQLLVSHIALAFISMLTFSALLFATSVYGTYRRAEADLLAVAQEMIRELAKGTAPGGLAIPDLYRHRFGTAPRDHAYFAVWDQQGTILTATPNLPDHARPADKIPPTQGPHPFDIRTSGRDLDVIVAAPHNGQLLIGRPLAKEWDGLEWLIGRTLGLGALCLAGGSAIAWWLARRLSTPMTRLADLAESTTSRRLHQRIELTDGSREAARLGQAFNQMLSGLQTAFEKQTRFIADASHELRTPVSVVLSQAEHSLHRERSTDEYRQGMQVCLQSARRMKGLIDDLLFLARVDAGKLVLRPVPIDLGVVAEQTVELLRPLASANSIRLETDCRLAQVVADPDRLGQIITNLVTNAIHYSHPGGRVDVQTYATENEVILRVKDEGIGIPMEDQPRLFDRFYRVDTARTQVDDTGTGLGLSLVHELVAAHGGTIDVQSTLGTGTTMSVHLPTGSSHDLSSREKQGEDR